MGCEVRVLSYRVHLRDTVGIRNHIAELQYNAKYMDKGTFAITFAALLKCRVEKLQ